MESFDIPPELLEYLRGDPSYVICPGCSNVWENAGAGSEEDCKHVKTEDGNFLSAECRQHYTAHRFRCQRCEEIFCHQCDRIPYHLGYTCEGFREALTSFKCRWCQEPILQESLGATGPPKNAERLSCSSCAPNDSAVMTKDQPECNHPAIWHHSMPTRKIPDCIRPECVRGRGSEEQTSEDFCAICGADALGAFPCVKLRCNHIFHVNCVSEKLKHRWDVGKPVNLSFMDCPLCKSPIDWPAINQPFVGDRKSVV